MDNTSKPGEVSPSKPVLVAKDFLAAAILLVVIVFLWIGLGVYKILTKAEIPPPVAGLARPIKLEFPQQVFDDLNHRQNYRDKNLNETDRVILSAP